jgi:hypothetical protein
MVFNHLLEFEWDDEDDEAPQSLDDASVPALLSAQATTADWLERVGAHTEPPQTPTLDEAARQAARAAFCSVVDPHQDPMQAKNALMAMHAPPAVRHLAGMLTQYDWAFVRQAQEIRGFIVAKLVEHATSPDAKVSLAALKTLGTVTEIGAYTERIEIDHRQKDVTPDAVVSRLRERLQSLLPHPKQEAEIAEAVVIENATASEV